MRSGGAPRRASSLPSDVTKHVACAAASSSSGLVFPSRISTRDAMVDGSSNEPVLTRAHDARSARGRALPVDLGLSDDARHQAMTSTRDSSLRSSGVSAASFSMTRWSAWIETSTWSSARLARREPLQPETGREQRHQHPVVLVLARVPDELVGEPGDDGQEQDPTRDQPVPDRPPDEREDEDRDHHDPEQKRSSATRVNQAELLHVLRA